MPYLSDTRSPVLLNRRTGRQLGAKGKANESIRWGIVEAYRQLGGVDGLVKWGKANPSLFYPMLKSLLPHELAESGLSGSITVHIHSKPRQPVEITQADLSTDTPLHVDETS
jgi:hypothetical protein